MIAHDILEFSALESCENCILSFSLEVFYYYYYYYSKHSNVDKCGLGLKFSRGAWFG